MNTTRVMLPAVFGPPAPGLRLALVDASDLDDVMRLVEDEGWGGYDRKDLELVLNVSPEGCWKLVDAGALVGTVFTLRTGKVAYLSFFILRKAYRDFGLGFRLGATALAAARQRAEAVIIFANKKLVSAYARNGFTSLGDVTRFQLRGDRSATFSHVKEARADELSTIERLNELCYHDARGEVVRQQFRCQGARCFVHERPGGACDGYAFTRKAGDRYLLGPLVAVRDEAAVDLLGAVRAALPDEVLIADAPVLAFSRLLEEHRVEYELRKSVEKMYLGDERFLEAEGVLRAIGGHHFG